MRIRSKLLLVLSAATLSCASNPPLTYPHEGWLGYESPQAAGWSPTQLQEAESLARSLGSRAGMVVHEGRVVTQWGETDRPLLCDGVANSLLSATFGILKERGRIDLDDRLSDLGIDDFRPQLSEMEKSARVVDLLRSRSGVYRPAVGESEDMRDARPPRESRRPGRYWHYNEWDFNALRTIFDQAAGTSFYRFFAYEIARPLQMQDYSRKGQHYAIGPESMHPAFPLLLSARDLARFGLMMARGGRWQGRQVIDDDWVEVSTRAHSDAGHSGGYGYLWWVADQQRHFPYASLPDGSFSARGAGGNSLVVIPAWDLVVVNRVDLSQPGKRISAPDFGILLSWILAARPSQVGSGWPRAPARPNAVEAEPADPRLLQGVAGRYESRGAVLPGFPPGFEVRSGDGELRLVLDGSSAGPLQYVGGGRFLLERATRVFLEFEVKSGRVADAIVEVQGRRASYRGIQESR